MALTDDHASGVLTEIAGQSQYVSALLEIVSNPSVFHI